MAFALGFVLLGVLFVIIKYFNSTDQPKIKGIPEIPGYPLFGSLLEFGSQHAKVAQRLAKRYGAVFQVRLGNRVGSYLTYRPYFSNMSIADCVCKHV